MTARAVGDKFAAQGFTVRYPMGVPVIDPPSTFEERLRLMNAAEQVNVDLRIYAEGVVLSPRLG